MPGVVLVLVLVVLVGVPDILMSVVAVVPLVVMAPSVEVMRVRTLKTRNTCTHRKGGGGREGETDRQREREMPYGKTGGHLSLRCYYSREVMAHLEFASEMQTRRATNIFSIFAVV